jgi:hypothetical protein
MALSEGCFCVRERLGQTGITPLVAIRVAIAAHRPAIYADSYSLPIGIGANFATTESDRSTALAAPSRRRKAGPSDALRHYCWADQRRPRQGGGGRAPGPGALAPSDPSHGRQLRLNLFAATVRGARGSNAPYATLSPTACCGSTAPRSCARPPRCARRRSADDGRRADRTNVSLSELSTCARHAYLDEFERRMIPCRVRRF